MMSVFTITHSPNRRLEADCIKEAIMSELEAYMSEGIFLSGVFIK